jgi:multiple sugar transport system substrate-binding protein
MGAGSLLQACGGAAPTATPQVIEKIVEKPVEKVVTQVVEKPVEKVVTQVVQVTPTPMSQAKVTGNLVVLQERGYNPLQTTYIHNLLIKTAAQLGWPLDKSYQEAYTGGTNFVEKFSASVKAGDSPDLCIPITQSTFLLWNLKTLSAVDDVVDWATKEFGKPAPGFKLSNNFEGKWYAVPYFTATGGYWARKSWFDPISGYDITKQHSLQEWLDACVQISEPDKKRWGWGNTVNRSGDGDTNVGWPIWEAGGRLTDENNRVVFNSEFTVLAYEWLKDVYTNPKYAKALPTGVNSWTDPSNNEAYLAGTIGFSSNAGTMFATAIATKPDIAKDTHLVPAPSGPVGKKETAIFGPGIFNAWVPAGAKNPEAAREMIKVLLSKENQKAVWKNSPGHSLPAYEWGWDEPEANTAPNDVAKIFKANVFSDKVFYTFLPGPQPRLWIDAVSQEAVLTDTMANIFKGTPVKQAVEEAHARIEGIHKKFEGK